MAQENGSVTSGDLPFSRDLFDAADALRGAVESAVYKHLVLGLLFLKYISETFERHRETLDTKTRDPGHELYTDNEDVRAEILEDRDEYLAANVFWVPEEARWDKLLAAASQSGLGKKIDDALEAVEKANIEQLRGVLPRVYARSELPNENMGELVRTVARVGFGEDWDKAKDVLGRTYEYFIKAFAKKEGHRGGEFFTPGPVVRMIVEMLEPFEGIVLDPASGSCGMFIQSARFTEAHGGRAREISIHGQEMAMTNWRIGMMNLAIHGLTGNINGGTSSLTNDQHKGLKAQFVIANPPFNQKKWGAAQVAGDARWRFGDPADQNANFAWIQHFIAHLAPDGRAGFVMSNGTLSSTQNGEGDIRAEIVENDLVDCIIACPAQLFYTTPIPVCLWFIDREKTRKGTRDHRRETLFMDARLFGEKISRTQFEFTEDEIERVSQTYHAWRGEPDAGDYEDEIGFCKAATIEEIAADGYNLNPGRYVGTREIELDLDTYAEKMDVLSAELDHCFARNAELEERIRTGLQELGHG